MGHQLGIGCRDGTIVYEQSSWSARAYAADQVTKRQNASTDGIYQFVADKHQPGLYKLTIAITCWAEAAAVLEH